MTGTPGTTAAACPHAISCRKHKPRSLPSQPRLTPITSLWMTRPSLCRGIHNFLGYPTQPCYLSWKGTRIPPTPTLYPTQDYECVIRVNYPAPHAAAPAVHHGLDIPSSLKRHPCNSQNNLQLKSSSMMQHHPHISWGCQHDRRRTYSSYSSESCRLHHQSSAKWWRALSMRLSTLGILLSCGMDCNTKLVPQVGNFFSWSLCGHTVSSGIRHSCPDSS